MKGFGWPVFRFPPFIFFSAGDFLVFLDSCTVYIVTIWNISPQISSFPSISPLLPGHFSILRPCTGNYGGKINVKVVLPRRLFSVLLMAKRDICASSENIPPLSRWKAFWKEFWSRWSPAGSLQNMSRPWALLINRGQFNKGRKEENSYIIQQIWGQSASITVGEMLYKYVSL